VSGLQAKVQLFRSFMKNTYLVQSDGVWTRRETTLLLLAGNFTAGEEFAGSFPAWNRVVACVIVDWCLDKHKCQCELRVRSTRNMPDFKFERACIRSCFKPG